MEKNEALKHLNMSAKLYEENLENRSLLFLYVNRENNKIEALEADFLASNFAHLTGVDTEIDPKGFYQKCLDKRLSPDDFNYKPDGTTLLKIDVLPELMKIHNSAKMLGTALPHGISLYTEKVAGSTHGCMGFTRKADTNYAPNTVLKADIRDVSSSTNQVIAVLRKAIGGKIFSEVTYVAKKKDIKTLPIPGSIKAKIDSNVFKK